MNLGRLKRAEFSNVIGPASKANVRVQLLRTLLADALYRRHVDAVHSTGTYQKSTHRNARTDESIQLRHHKLERYFTAAKGPCCVFSAWTNAFRPFGVCRTRNHPVRSAPNQTANYANQCVGGQLGTSVLGENLNPGM